MTELTEREQEILNLIANGYSTKQIAELLGCSEYTISNHRASILEKTQANNMAQAFKAFSKVA